MPPPQSPPNITRLMDQFDLAWQSSAVPRIEEVMPAAKADVDVANRKPIEELVKIDLEYRWRQCVPIRDALSTWERGATGWSGRSPNRCR
jgi:hypothetical protein